MASEMQNIDIRDFTTVGTVESYDYVVVSLFGGQSAKMTVDLLRKVVSRGMTPTIAEDGFWYIGEETTGVVAEGKTPMFRKGTAAIEWKYTSEPDTAWRTLVTLYELRMRYEDLTEEQILSLKLKYEDLTEEDIAELQRPAVEIKAVLEETNTKVAEAEAARVEAEAARVEAEAERNTAETERATAEEERTSAEEERISAEGVRMSNELQRISDEASRVSAETQRESAEQTRRSNEQTRISQESARVSAEKNRASAEASRVSAENLRASEFERLKSESETATASAQDTADHPTYIGEDNYVYQWDKTAGAYNKTAIYVRGEAFSIKKVYSSVDEMYADTSTGFKEGDFCLINTNDVENPEDARLYVRTAGGSWSFLVDMSGAIGFTGKTPQLFIGNVSVGSGKDSASVTLTPSGIDDDGNPKYSINYIIPYLAYEDLTEEQIAELQRPANDMIAQLQATDDTVKGNEAARVTAEQERVSDYANLKQGILSATDNANTAADAANQATGNANDATQTALGAADTADVATANANEATLKANTAADNADIATGNADAATEAANQAAQTALDSASTADVATANANEATSKADAAADNADVATGKANEATSAANQAAKDATEATDAANASATAATDAAEAANEAALKARKLPVIKNGTWWLYDVDADVYVDSGYAVDSDYQLTREKIENVFTGNVESHWHDRYVDKVDGKQLSTEDFTTGEKEKLEGLSNYDDTGLRETIDELSGELSTWGWAEL